MQRLDQTAQLDRQAARATAGQVLHANVDFRTAGAHQLRPG